MDLRNYLLPENFIKDDHAKQYFAGHLDRFLYHIDVFERLISGPTDEKTAERFKVYDFGSWLPFSTWYFYKKYKARVIYFYMERAEPLNERVEPCRMNLCDPVALYEADVVVATEVLEHLPCNLYNTLDFMAKCVKKGGYLFLSFPTGPIGADIGYNKDIPGKRPDIEHEHLREFPIEKAREFYGRLKFEVLEEKCVKTLFYNNADGILHVLLRKR